MAVTTRRPARTTRPIHRGDRLDRRSADPARRSNCAADERGAAYEGIVSLRGTTGTLPCPLAQHSLQTNAELSGGSDVRRRLKAVKAHEHTDDARIREREVIAYGVELAVERHSL